MYSENRLISKPIFTQGPTHVKNPNPNQLPKVQPLDSKLFSFPCRLVFKCFRVSTSRIVAEAGLGLAGANRDWRTSGANRDWWTSGANRDWRTSGANRDWRTSGRQSGLAGAPWRLGLAGANRDWRERRRDWD
jgi:hypothetical protein